jgi:putative sigma-54 modulation protein
MNIAIHPIHFDASSKLVDFLNKKLNKLETFFDRIIQVDVFLKLDSNQSVKDKIVEIKLHVPGNTLFASETSKTFEESTDLVLDSISRQLKKHKGKLRAKS